MGSTSLLNTIQTCSPKGSFLGAAAASLPSRVADIKESEPRTCPYMNLKQRAASFAVDALASPLRRVHWLAQRGYQRLPSLFA